MTPANDNAPTGASIRFVVEPRLIPQQKAARRLHLTSSEFEAKRPALARAGFPKACPITGHFDLKAIDAWLDRQAGLTAALGSTSVSDMTQIVSQRLAALG